MGWETRRGKRYYYRTRRVRGRVVRQYFGCGPAAEEAARQDLEAAAERARVFAVREQTRVELDALMLTFDAMDAECDAAWIAAGYYKYRGVWRKKRKPREAATPAGEAPGGA